MSYTQKNAAFGNGAFGSSRPTTSRIGSAAPTMSGRPPVAPRGYVPPALRQPTFEEMYPALGGATAPVVKKTVLVEDARPSLLNVARARADADAIEAEIEAQRQKRLALKVEENYGMVIPPAGRYLRAVAARKAREEQQRHNQEVALLCEHSSLFRSYFANSAPQRYYEESEQADERWSDDGPSDGGSYDGANEEHTD